MPNPVDRRTTLAALSALVAGLTHGAYTAREDSRAEKSLQNFLDTWVVNEKIPGLSLAVARDGRLAHAVAAGVADPATGEKLTPTHLFRVASVSKPLTGLVVARLIERGLLKADAPVHALLGLPKPRDERWTQVTVEQLLRHTGGWDRDKSFDPMFRSATICAESRTDGPARPDQVIAYMLRQPLDFQPGSRFAYSNFGYCLLGRLIGKVTGLSYEQATRQEVLTPLGISRMRLGRTLREKKAPAEVVYSDTRGRRGNSVMGMAGQVDEPYGCWCLETMDAHGGWLATPADLVRWGVALDESARPALLKPATIQRIWSRPPGDNPKESTWYGWGWQVRQTAPGKLNAWHNGSLPGTASLLVRRHDGLVWALAANTNANPAGKPLSGVLDGLIHQAVNSALPLDGHDLFPKMALKTAR